MSLLGSGYGMACPVALSPPAQPLDPSRATDPRTFAPAPASLVLSSRSGLACVVLRPPGLCGPGCVASVPRTQEGAG
jgi:nucleoside-diphosphate-sugar epimerase